MKFVSKMTEFNEKLDESEVSDFELSEDFTNFNLVQLDKNERRHLERQWNAFVVIVMMIRGL